MPNWFDLIQPLVLLESLTDDSLNDWSDNLIQFKYTHSVEKMDSCELILSNKYGQFNNDPRFDREIKFRCRFGYPGMFSEVASLITVQASPTYPFGFPTISILAYDQGRELVRGSNPRNWGRVTSSEVARRIAARHNLSAVGIEESNDQTRHAVVQPGNVSDYEFLARLADRLNYDFYIVNNALYFHPLRLGESPSHHFTYYSDGSGILKSFQPSIKTVRPTRAQLAGMSAGGSASTNTSNPNSQRALGNTRRGRFINSDRGNSWDETVTEPSTSTNRPVIHPSPETSTAVRQRRADAVQHKIEMRANEANAKLIGYPTLRSRQIVRIDVDELKYTGLWRAKTATHTISMNGYETELELHRAETNSTNRTGSGAVPGNVQNRNGNTSGGGNSEEAMRRIGAIEGDSSDVVNVVPADRRVGR